MAEARWSSFHYFFICVKTADININCLGFCSAMENIPKNKENNISLNVCFKRHTQPFKTIYVFLALGNRHFFIVDICHYISNRFFQCFSFIIYRVHQNSPPMHFRRANTDSGGPIRIQESQ